MFGDAVAPATPAAPVLTRQPASGILKVKSDDSVPPPSSPVRVSIPLLIMHGLTIHFVQLLLLIAAQEPARSHSHKHLEVGKLEEPAQFIDHLKRHDRVDSEFLSALKSKLRHGSFRRAFLDLDGWKVRRSL